MFGKKNIGFSILVAILWISILNCLKYAFVMSITFERLCVFKAIDLLEEKITCEG